MVRTAEQNDSCDFTCSTLQQNKACFKFSIFVSFYKEKNMPKRSLDNVNKIPNVKVSSCSSMESWYWQIKIEYLALKLFRNFLIYILDCCHVDEALLYYSRFFSLSFRKTFKFWPKKERRSCLMRMTVRIVKKVNMKAWNRRKNQMKI